MKQTIDISPDKVAPIARAALRFFTLETTLVPGNLRQQLTVLEVFLSGLSTGELVLATPPRAPVESDVKGDDPRKEPDEVPEKGQELGGPRMRPPAPAEFELMREAETRTGAGEGQSG